MNTRKTSSPTIDVSFGRFPGWSFMLWSASETLRNRTIFSQSHYPPSFCSHAVMLVEHWSQTRCLQSVFAMGISWKDDGHTIATRERALLCVSRAIHELISNGRCKCTQIHKFLQCKKKLIDHTRLRCVCCRAHRFRRVLHYSVATVQQQGDTMPSMITSRAVYAVGSHSPSSIFLYYFVPRGKFIMQINANNSAAICTRAASINSLCVLPIDETFE